MALKPLNHYSLTTPASIYDEEALTAIELAARTAKKVNDCVEAFNELEENIDVHVDKSVNEHITAGAFDKQIDKHTAAISREVEGLFEEVNDLDNRVDNLIVSGAENSPEVVDIRSGADGVTYKTAGSAVRGQFNKKVDTTEHYDVVYETGGLSITESGWNYSEQYAKNSRVRIKEGHELHLKAGDVIGLRDYSDARFYVGIRINGIYTFAGWLTRDYVVESDGDYVILVAHATDVNLNQPENPDILGSLIFVRKLNGVANLANHAPENISAALDIDLGFTLGAMNTTGVYNVFNRFVTRDILCLDIDIVVRRSDRCRVAVYTFSDGNGSGVSDKGWVTDRGDYIIKAGTYFRLMAMSESYDIENRTHINPAEQFNSDLYKAITVEPLNGRGINLMRTTATTARISAFNAMVTARKVVVPRKVRAINHRGYNYEKTENTAAAYKASKSHGFDFVECDVRFTSDGIPVLFHDDTVDRISNGSGRVHEKTLAELKSLDLQGETITTFDEFMMLCAVLQIHPYIEIEPDGDTPITIEQTRVLMAIVRAYGMTHFVTWISFRGDDLLKVVQLDPTARVGLIVGADVNSVENPFKICSTLMTGVNEVFIDLQYNSPVMGGFVNECVKIGMALEVWTVNSDNPAGVAVVEAYPYISGVTSDNADIGQVIVDKLTAPSKTLLTVTISGNGGSMWEDYTITFEDGMTWGEWANSEYNTLGFDGSYCIDYGTASINDSEWNMVNTSAVIDPNATYYFGS